MNLEVVTTDPIARLLGTWSSGLTVGSVLLRIALSLLMGAFIGWERSSKRHSAGLRTFMLTFLIGTLAAIVDSYTFCAAGRHGHFLLSAGTVVGAAIIAVHSVYYSSRNQIKGITTSAGLLVCCLLGVSIGAGFYTLTAVAALAMLFCLSLLPTLEVALKDRSNHFEVHLELTSSHHLKEFVATIRELGLKIDDIETNPAYVNSGLSVYSIAISITRNELKKFKTHKEIIDALATLEYVSHIEEI